jgi:small subunit ribosomal protein S19
VVKAGPRAAATRSPRGASPPRASAPAQEQGVVEADHPLASRQEEGALRCHVPSGKGPFVDSYVLKKAEKSRESGRNEVIKIWSRRSTILPQFVGLTFGVYNGQKHIPVLVTEDMIGQKFGEYSPTRTYYGHAADKKAKRK